MKRNNFLHRSFRAPTDFLKNEFRGAAGTRPGEQAGGAADGHDNSGSGKSREIDR
jgi:hypothetical protein